MKKKTIKVRKWTRCMKPPPHRQFLNGFMFSQSEITKQLKHVSAIGKDAKKCEHFGKAICEFAEAYVGSMLRLAKMSPLKRMEINESSSVDVILNMTADKKLEHALKVLHDLGIVSASSEAMIKQLRESAKKFQAPSDFGTYSTCGVVKGGKLKSALLKGMKNVPWVRDMRSRTKRPV